MSTLLEIRETILKEIRPTPSEVEAGFQAFNQIKQAIHHVTEEKKIEVAFIDLEGSSGKKQTQLRNWRELDIFIGLHPAILDLSIELEKPKKPILQKLFRKLVSEVGIEAAKQAGCQTPRIAYAEHPYVSATLGDYKVDIVFCFNLTPKYIFENGPITAVDRTPHHSHFIDKHLTNAQRDDVRLLKAFFHSNYVYGDSSPVGRSGFTGFCTEMIIYHHQNIDAALEFLSQSEPKPLDMLNRSSLDLKKRFSRELLIIIDPTDPNRNIASSISKRAYQYTQYNAIQLLRKPTTSYFAMQPIPVLSKADLQLLKPNYYVIEFIDETGWHYTKTRDKLYRYFTKLEKFLNHEPTGEPRFGSVIFEEVFQEPIFVIALYVEKTRISDGYIRTGPPPEFTEGTEEFMKKHPGGVLHNGRYQVEISRIFTQAEQALRHYLTANPLSPKLTLIDITHQGKTVLGKQALWILTQAILPLIDMKP